jgi:D-beta-D-heptose 7-phosphate kinase/D-beta-D-heptose 1-phosphate adenosyltransferase
VIRAVQPDVLVKGGDWSVDRIIGADVVRARGGDVRSLPYVAGLSTSALLKRIAAAALAPPLPPAGKRRSPRR